MKKLWLNDVLETQRCTMKIAEESDANEVWELIDDEVSYFMDWEKWENSDHILQTIIKWRDRAEKWLWWYAMVYLKDGTCIWRFGIPQLYDKTNNIEIGFWIGKEYWWKWYIPECFSKMKEIAFRELWVETIHLTVNPKNDNCKKVAIKSWLTYDWTLKNWERIKWKLIPAEFYSVTRNEYLNKK